MSAAGSRARAEGLNTFYEKWRHRMTPELEAAFFERAARLFGWKYQPSPERTIIDHATTPGKSVAKPLSIIVGIITDSAIPQRVEPLLGDLLELSRRDGIGALDVLLVENGPRPADGTRPLQALASRKRLEGLRCFLIDLERQRQAPKILFGPSYDGDEQKRKPLSITRTIAQVYAALHARSRPGSIVWILDDDVRLRALVEADRGQPVEVVTPDIQALAALANAGIDVALGSVTDAAPLPFASTVRTQMVDLYHNLHALGRLNPASYIPDLSAANRQQRGSPDYYYDLARRKTDQLESPFWIELPEGSSVRNAFMTIATQVGHIFAGCEVFRPLIIDRSNTAVADSICRGPSSVFFNPEQLLEIPNTLGFLDGKPTRRSDIISAVLLRDHLGARIVETSAVAVRQVRADLEAGSLDTDTLRKDIIGYALYSALVDLMERRRPGKQRLDDLHFADDELSFVVARFRKYVHERVAAYVLSVWRVRGLTKAIGSLLAGEKSRLTWWHKDLSVQLHLHLLREFLGKMQIEVDVANLASFRTELESIPDEAVRQWAATLKDHIAEFRTTMRSRFSFPFSLDAQRIDIARAQVQRHSRPSALRLLGTGLRALRSLMARACTNASTAGSLVPIPAAWYAYEIMLASGRQPRFSIRSLHFTRMVPTPLWCIPTRRVFPMPEDIRQTGFSCCANAGRSE